LYTEFYGLREKPFALVPDTRYLFLSESHREALAHLLYGVREGEGFIAVVGQVGTGKTTLCRTLIERVEKDVDVGFIFNPSASEIELLAAINREFGIPAASTTRSELIEELNRFLVARRAAGRRVLLVIDEAQNLTPAVLEQIRLLSNLETERGKLLQILLLGQPELEANLSRPELRQLRQRISVRWDLEALTRAETDAYVEHRMRVAGGRGFEVFGPRALDALYSASRGVPRLINAVADRALLAGYSEGKRRLTAGVVRRAARELPGARTRRGLRGLAALSASSLLAAGVLGGILLQGWDLVGAVGPRSELPSVSAPSPQPLAAEPMQVATVALEPEDALVPLGVPGDLSSPAPSTPPRSDLEKWLSVRTPGATGALAIDAVLEAWGYEPLGYPELFPEGFAAALEERTSLLVLEMQSELDQLLRLNAPAVLELELSAGEMRYAALVRDDPSGELHLQANGRRFALERAPLAELFTGRTLLLWTNFESVPELRYGMRGAEVRWLQRQLVLLGYLAKDDLSGVFEEDTRAAVRRLQVDHSLEPTGEMGTATLIALYHRLRFGAPVLFAAGES
jgi:general secretion pathway protein A